MLRTKVRRHAFSLYISIVILLMGIITFFTGIDSPWPWMCISFFVFVPILYMKFVKLPVITWKDSYVVGVGEIDHDHKKLLELINRVVLASNYKFGKDYSKDIFNELIEYTKYHFDREIKLMEEYDFPDRKNHAIQHNKFVNKINGFYREFDNSSRIAKDEIFDFLTSWLLNHIGKSDKELGAFIQVRRENESEPVYETVTFKSPADVLE